MCTRMLTEIAHCQKSLGMYTKTLSEATHLVGTLKLRKSGSLGMWTRGSSETTFWVCTGTWLEITHWVCMPNPQKSLTGNGYVSCSNRNRISPFQLQALKCGYLQQVLGEEAVAVSSVFSSCLTQRCWRSLVRPRTRTPYRRTFSPCSTTSKRSNSTRSSTRSSSPSPHPRERPSM